jgi:hypothetical protein
MAIRATSPGIALSVLTALTEAGRRAAGVTGADATATAQEVATTWRTLAVEATRIGSDAHVSITLGAETRQRVRHAEHTRKLRIVYVHERRTHARALPLDTQLRALEALRIVYAIATPVAKVRDAVDGRLANLPRVHTTFGHFVAVKRQTIGQLTIGLNFASVATLGCRHLGSATGATSATLCLTTGLAASAADGRGGIAFAAHAALARRAAFGSGAALAAAVRAARRAGARGTASRLAALAGIARAAARRLTCATAARALAALAGCGFVRLFVVAIVAADCHEETRAQNSDHTKST